MSMVKDVAHTPGPWKLLNHCRKTSNFDPSYRETVLGPAVDGHADPVATVHGVTREETVANARLIAAAPELLVAAKQVAADFDLQIRGSRAPNYMQHWQELQAAIAKAEGTTP